MPVVSASSLEPDAAQHLVLDLDGIARIEKVAVLKLGIANLLGGRMQRALFAESGDLGALAIVVCRHVGPRETREQES